MSEHSELPRDLPPAADLADAIVSADWSGVSIGNKEMLKAAIIHLRSGDPAQSVRMPGVMSIQEALRDCTCPRPGNDEPDDLTVGQCFDKRQCGCQNGVALTAALDATTISCSGKDITIACDDHDTKQAVMDALTGADIVTVIQRALLDDDCYGNKSADQDDLEECARGSAVMIAAALRPSQAAAVEATEDERWISEAKSTLDRMASFLQKTGAPHRVDWKEWIDSADKHLGLKWPSEAARPPELDNEVIERCAKVADRGADEMAALQDHELVREHDGPRLAASIGAGAIREVATAIRALRREG